MLDAEFVVEFFELLVVELRAIIRNDLLRYVVLTYYYLSYKILDLFAGDHCEQFSFGPFCEIINNDHNIFEGRSRCG